MKLPENESFRIEELNEEIKDLKQKLSQKYTPESVSFSKEHELFETIVDNIPVMITIYDPGLNNFRLNKALKDITGWTEEDAADGNLLAKVYPDPEYRQSVIEYMQSLQPGWRELVMTAKNGKQIESSWANINLPSGVQIGIGIDISERRKTEATLRENEQRLQGLFNNAAIGIVITDSEDHISVVNDHLCDILGYTHEELTGKNITELTAPEDRSLSDSVNYRLHSGELKTIDYEKRYLKRDGSPLWVHVTTSTVVDPSGKHINSIRTVEDISVRKAAEEAIRLSAEMLSKKNEELTQFIHTVSHDLKSPLVTIKSFTAYLREDIEQDNKEAQARDIGYIGNAADRMGRLLDELLELSRIGRKEKPKSEFPMKEIAQSAVDLVAGRISQRGVNVAITGPDVMLYGHQERLLQLYQNLIDNAVKFMGNQPEPLIEIGSFAENRNKVVLFVRDNGSGIDPKYHKRVFGLFEKLDNKAEGSGLGLALIKRIVEVHGGEIRVDSEGRGKGATFFFTLEGTRVQA
ncbi:MAG TPA: PAS domain S-box protein [Bacteroidales bacterium]|nr:PAS domain S-box protein [Bacteroidales bacterium]